MVLTSYIASLIIPFTFANRHNENLKKRLSAELAGFEPNFDLGINGFQLSFKKVIKLIIDNNFYNLIKIKNQFGNRESIRTNAFSVGLSNALKISLTPPPEY